MPKRIEELKGCPSERRKLTTYEKVKRARKQYYKWKKMQEERYAFNRDQTIASRINPV